MRGPKKRGSSQVTSAGDRRARQVRRDISCQFRLTWSTPFQVHLPKDQHASSPSKRRLGLGWYILL